MKRSTALALVLALRLVPIAAAEEPSLAPSELAAGDRGYGLSVFSGEAPERFEVEILGVLGNFRAGTDYILARLSGHDLERSGVAAGMSGSPVYVDDRLVGAVAWAWPFSQDAIAGITPIGVMRQVGTEPAPAPAPASLVDPLQLASQQLPADLLERSLRALRPATLGEASAAPLWAVSGFGEGSRSFLAQALGTGVAAAGSRPEADPGSLEPGSAVAGVLVDGDLRMAVTGTVTEVRGDEILAFGHPFLGAGPLQLPMATAEILTVVASRASSFKVSNVGRVVGAFEEDRAAGVRGRMGLVAPTIPLKVRVGEELFSMQLADLPSLVPALMATAVYGALDTASRSAGPMGLDVEARWELAGHGPLAIRQSFDGDSAALEAMTYLLAVTGFLTRNPLEAVQLEGIEVTLAPSPAPRTATLVAAHAEKTRVHPGETVVIHLELAAWRGEPYRDRVEIALPEELPVGTYYLLLGDGVSLDAARLTVEKTAPIRFRQALELLRSFHSRRELVALGLFAEPGLAVAGEALPRLPSSMRSLWSAAASQSAQPLALAVAQEEVFPMDRPVSGAVRIDLEILRREPLVSGEEKSPTPAPSSESSP